MTAHFELGRGKRAFFRVWLIVLIVLFLVAVAIVVFRKAG
jgi:flagellar basal body-associated protein FliL